MANRALFDAGLDNGEIFDELFGKGTDRLFDPTIADTPSPFGPHIPDYPNPRGPQRSVELLSHIHGTVLAPLVLLELPSYYDATPPPGPVFSNDLRGFVAGIAVDLLGLDQFFSDPGMGPSYDYPNPKGPQRAVDLLTWTNGLVVGHQSDQPIFFGAPGQSITYDWPNPRGPQRAINLLTWIGPDLVISTLSVPFAMFDWPVPSGPRRVVDLLTALDSFKLTLRGKDQFFGTGGPQYDYPNPRGPRRPIGLLTHLDEGNVILPVDLPDADRRSYWRSDNLPPRGPRRSVDLLTHLRSRRLGQDKFFYAAGMGPNYDYPNPSGPRYPVHLRTFINLIHDSVLIILPPGHQIEIPIWMLSALLKAQKNQVARLGAGQGPLPVPLPIILIPHGKRILLVGFVMNSGA